MLMIGRRLGELPLPTDANGAELYAEKAGVDVRLVVGDPNGLASLGADGKIPAAQLPPA